MHLPRSSTPRSFLQECPGADLARRKSGVQIPSPPPQTQQVRASSVAHRRRSRQAAAAAQVTVQPERLSATRRPGPKAHTMTPQRGRRQLPTDGRSSPASRLSRSATRSTWPTAQPPPHHDDQLVDQAECGSGWRSSSNSTSHPAVAGLQGDQGARLEARQGSTPAWPDRWECCGCAGDAGLVDDGDLGALARQVHPDLQTHSGPRSPELVDPPSLGLTG
jgi:hypothetical protein